MNPSLVVSIIVLPENLVEAQSPSGMDTLQGILTSVVWDDIFIFIKLSS